MAASDSTTEMDLDGPTAVLVLQALPVPAALVDATGVVRCANEAWSLEALSADRLRGLIGEVLSGERPHFEVEVTPEHGHDRRTQLRATALGGGALVVLHDVTARWMLEASLRSVDGREPQTGLLDGSGTMEVLAQRLVLARQHGSPVAIAQIEVQGLDVVRRELGAPAAAEVMVQQVARVGQATRDDDVVSRISEDRMLLIFSGLAGVGLDNLVARLRRVLTEACVVGGRSIHVDVLIGRIVVPRGATAQDALDGVDADIRARATSAPRDAKGAADPRRSPTTPPAGVAAIGVGDARASEAARAVAAGRRNQASSALAFAPIVEARSGALVGAELVGDGTFGARLASAGRLVGAWRRSSPAVRPMVVVPLPLGWEHDAEQVLAEVREAIVERTVHPGALVLRLGGDDLAARPGPTTATLARLRALGVRVLLDDVARIAVPMVQLVGSPLDLIRVDVGPRIDGPALSVRTSVLGAVVGASRALGLEVIASGVDLEGERSDLAALGTSYLQGVGTDHRSAADLLSALQAQRTSPALPSAAEDLGARTGEPDELGADDLDGVFRSLSHEIRTPLTVVMGYASMLESSTDPSAASAAGAMRRATERIDRMLRNAEDVRMIDQGDLQLEVRDLDLRALVAEVVLEQRDVVGLHVVLDDEGADCSRITVSVDEVRLAQMLVNLISNAAKFSATGTTVEVGLVERDGWVEVEVRDEGPGIAAAQLALAFQKYGRADRTRPGSGLGLYLAQGVARAHGGDIAYRARPAGSGSIFALVLPTA